MSIFNVAEARNRFPELVQKAMLGEEVIITKDNMPVLKLVPLDEPKRSRKPGSGKGEILHIAADFDATPKGFKNYG